MIEMNGKKKIMFVATTPFAVNAFLRTHLLALAKTYDVTLCVNTELYPLLDDIKRSVRVLHVNIHRKMAPWRDLLALFQLFRCFRSVRPYAVHSIMPKTGLLAMIAGVLAGVPLRFHTFTGQVWANKTGVGRMLLKGIDRLIVVCSTQVFADSASQCAYLQREGVVRSGGVSVIGGGSIAGVDLGRFRPDPGARSELRSAAGVATDVPVFLYVGRLARDKGVFDLVEAFASLAKEHQDWDLWMVGPDEEALQVGLERRATELGGRVRFFPPTTQPERYMAAADVFVLPSHREGFGSVIIEAAACGVPAVAYRIDGVIDAVVENRTGCLVDKGDISGLALAMQELGRNREERTRLGNSALARVTAEFSSAAVSDAWRGFYASVLDAAPVKVNA